MATILVVDDDPDIRSLLTDFLTSEDYVVQTAADGSDALHMVQSRAFDLALVDIWLPGMPGIELLEHLKDLAPEMPVVIITSSSNPRSVDPVPTTEGTITTLTASPWTSAALNLPKPGSRAIFRIVMISLLS
jgi:DNA-binding NtrC family response regulator